MGYFKEVRDFTRDPATGERRFIDHLMLGFLIVFSPVALPLYYVGRAAGVVERKDC